jgi:hypothetical protein
MPSFFVGAFLYYLTIGFYCRRCSALPFSRRAVVDASNRSVACSGCGCDRGGGCRRRRYDDALPLNPYIMVVIFE